MNRNHRSFTISGVWYTQTKNKTKIKSFNNYIVLLLYNLKKGQNDPEHTLTIVEHAYPPVSQWRVHCDGWAEEGAGSLQRIPLRNIHNISDNICHIWESLPKHCSCTCADECCVGGDGQRDIGSDENIVSTHLILYYYIKKIAIHHSNLLTNLWWTVYEVE